MTGTDLDVPGIQIRISIPISITVAVHLGPIGDNELDVRNSDCFHAWLPQGNNSDAIRV